MIPTAKVVSSETGSVIRFHGKPAPLPIKQICPSINSLQFQLEELRNQIYTRHLEYIETEKENKLLDQKVQELDDIIKQHDYEVACLKYTIEKTRLEKTKLEGSLKDSKENSRMAIQPEVNYIPSKNESRVGQAEKTSPRNVYHVADLQEEPKIFCVCGVQFTTKQNLREHIKYHTLGMNFACPKCDIRKHGLNQLRTHMKVTHNVSSSYLASMKGCRLCGQLFTSLAQLHEHRRKDHFSAITRL